MGDSSNFVRWAAMLTLGLFAAGASAQEAAAPAQIGPADQAQPMQLAKPDGAGQAPATITLQDALARAKKLDAQYLGAVNDAKNAHDDTLISRNVMLPSASALSQYLGTQANGVIPTGRFVTNDGVHVYRAWGVFKEDLSPTTYLATGYHRAQAAEALAKAKAEIAQRGLNVTVTKDYYGLAAAQRKYAAAQASLDEAQRFLNATQASENTGQSAHADVVKAQIQFEQQRQAFDEAELTMENARLTLAVLLFPTLNEDFTVVDDLDAPVALPAFSEMQAMAGRENPDLHVAMELLRQADVDVAAAKGAFLPSFSVETDYGIEANAFALRSVVSAQPDKGPLPNLGYFLTAGVTIPVWDWGTLRDKLRQSQRTREQAQAELSQTQRELVANLYSAYNEATVARAAVESARRAADSAAESLRLVDLRYQAGESTALEVVDAQNTATQTRAGYADAQVRYRVALATLQTFTGSF